MSFMQLSFLHNSNQSMNNLCFTDEPWFVQWYKSAFPLQSTFLIHFED